MSNYQNNPPFELFIKTHNIIHQNGGHKNIKNKQNKQSLVTESITSIENLSDTSESQQSKYIMNNISSQLQKNIIDIN